MDSSCGSSGNLLVQTSRNPIFTDDWRTLIRGTKRPVRSKPSKETLVYRKPRTTSEMEMDDLSNPSSSTTSFTSDFGSLESITSSLENVSVNVRDTRKRFTKRKEDRRLSLDMFCHVCYEAEMRACECVGEQAPSPFSQGPWLEHDATGPSGQYTCPLLFFQKKREMLFSHKLDYNEHC